jgi:hypothetical protein
MVDTVLTPNDDLFNAPGGQADTVRGIGGNDTINGNDRNDSLLGGAGDDRLDGGSDNDTLLGGDGNDSLNGASQDDSLLGGDGDDRLDGGSQNDTVRGEGGNDIITNASAGNDLMDGGADRDSIVGGSGNETLLGGDGNDTLLAGGGADSLVGGAGDDSIIGGGFGLESLLGGDGNDVLVANGDTALMFGGSGNDRFEGLTGNYGDKYVSGGGGADVAVFGGANYNPANWVVQSGTFQGQPYEAYYQVPDSYRVYFHEFNGVLDFPNIDVPVTVPCFAAGTLIMTPAGERAVETLRAGDLVVTAAGQGAPVKPVRWVGHREVDLGAHPRPLDAAPILVLPGALGPGVPHRPLRVSPDHALLVDGALVPAGLLADGVHILRLPARGRITWFHVELDAHDLLLSEGAASESYLDLGNRHAFANAGRVMMLHADFAPAPGPAAESCRPRVTGGAALEAVRRTLALRRGAAAAAG